MPRSVGLTSKSGYLLDYIGNQCNNVLHTARYLLCRLIFARLVGNQCNTGGDVTIPTYKPHTNYKKPSVRSHTLAPTTICDLTHSVCGSPLTDLGHISSVTYVCHPLWFVCGHRKGILTSPLNECPTYSTVCNLQTTALSARCI